MSIGKTVRALRRNLGLSQAELAAALDRGRSTIASIESGNDMPGRELVEALAQFFGVSVDVIMDRRGVPQPARAESEAEAELLTLYREANASVQSAVRTMLRAATKAEN